MPWTPKPTAPAYFSLADAFIALVTGDATWGWLVDWATLIPNLGQNTAEFCSAGPPTADPFSADLFNQTPNASLAGQAGHFAALTAALIQAAQDRVFGAYCEQTTPLVGGWGSWHFDTHTGPAGTASDIAIDIPAGATSIQWAIDAGSRGADNAGYASIYQWDGGGGFTVMYTTPGYPAYPSPFGVINTTAKVAGAIKVNISDVRLYTSTWRVRFNVADTPIVHVPTAQPAPAGVLSPIRTVAPTLVGIADEAERLELKLDTLLAMIQGIAGATLDLGGETQAPAELVADVPVAVGDAVGCVITTTGIPASRSMDFGTPQNVVRLGHLNCGTADAWFPSIWLTHTPFILRPFPQGTTRITITDLPPGASSTIALIARNK